MKQALARKVRYLSRKSPSSPAIFQTPKVDAVILSVMACDRYSLPEVPGNRIRGDLGREMVDVWRGSRKRAIKYSKAGVFGIG